MSTLTPHPPEEGWATRWPKQALFLITRGPGTFVLYLLATVVLGFLSLPAIAPAFISDALGSFSFTAFGAFIGVFFAAWTTGRFFTLDTGHVYTLVESWSIAKQYIPKAIIIGAVMMALDLVLPKSEDAQSGLSTAFDVISGSGISDILAIFFIGIVIATPMFTATLVALSWTSLIHVAVSMAFGASHQQAYLFCTQVSYKFYKVNLYFMAVLLSAILVANAFPFISPLLFYVVVGTGYVAARELAGGVRTNQTQEQTSGALKPTPA